MTCLATLLELPAARSDKFDIELALLEDLDDLDDAGIEPVPDCCIGILALLLIKLFKTRKKHFLSKKIYLLVQTKYSMFVSIKDIAMICQLIP